MMERNEAFLQKAEALKPTLHTRRVSAPGSEKPLKKGDSLTLDFGEHLVGYVTLRLGSVGSPFPCICRAEERWQQLDTGPGEPQRHPGQRHPLVGFCQ